MRDTPLPNCTPCSPAPNRYLIIIRTDSQPILSPSMTNFESFIPAGLINQASPYQSHSSALNSIPAADSPTTPTSNKKRWSLFKGLNMNNMFGAIPGNHRPGEVTPPGTPHENITSNPLADEVTIPDPNSAVAIPAPTTSRPATPPHQVLSFKFSLEWSAQRPDQRGSRRMTPPSLPYNAQAILQRHQNRQSYSSSSSGGGNSSSTTSGTATTTATTQSDSSDAIGSTSTKAAFSTTTPATVQDSDLRMRTRTGEIKPLKPMSGTHETSAARYSGRALAEWRQVLTESGHFYHRRRTEGVPKDHLIETPTLGVETFRLAG